jgi:YVTN family beta-propeller protein
MSRVEPAHQRAAAVRTRARGAPVGATPTAAEEARLIELGHAIERAHSEARTTRSRFRFTGVLVTALFVTFLVFVAVTPGGVPILVPFTTQQLWVANHPGTQTPGSAVARFSLTKTRALASTHTGSLPTGLGMSPDGGLVLATNRGAHTLSIIDTQTGKVEHSIRVGNAPDAVAAGNGRHQVPLAVVANVFSDDVTIVNLQTFQKVATVRVGIWPSAVFIAPGPNGGTGHALVADYGSNQLSIIDMATLKVQNTIDVGRYPNGITVVPGGTDNAGVAAVTDNGSNEVTPIDLGTRKALAPIPLPGPPTSVASSASTTIWVTEGASLLSIALLGRIMGPVFPMPAPAQSIVLDPDGHHAWVGQAGGVVQRVTLTTGALGRTFSVGGLPQSMLITTPLPGATMIKP